MEGGPLDGFFEGNPVEVLCAFSCGGPRFVSGALRPTVGIVGGFVGNFEGDLFGGIFASVGITGRIFPVVGEGPGVEVFLIKVGVLDVSDPREEGALAGNYDTGTIVEDGAVAGNF